MSTTNHFVTSTMAVVAGLVPPPAPPPPRRRHLVVFLSTPTIIVIIYFMNVLRPVHSFRNTVKPLQQSPPISFSTTARSLLPSRLLSSALSTKFPPKLRPLSPRISRMSFSSGSTTSVSGAQQQTQQGSSSNLSSSVANRPLVVVIAGPTASGKSDVAARLCLARSRDQNDDKDVNNDDGRSAIEGRGGIIVSADSVQAYRGVQIGANKPSTDERVDTPHILIDVADCEESYNAADWCNDALMTIEALLDPSASASVLSRATSTTTTTTTATTASPQNDDEDPASTEKRQTHILDTIQKARKDKGYDEQQSLLPVVCGGTMMYLSWLVHGRPDAMRPSPTAVRIAKETIESFQRRGVGVGSSDDNNDTTTPKSNYQAAVDHVSSFGPIFADRTQKFCGEDWYRLRRTLEIALTVQQQQQQQQQQEQQRDQSQQNEMDDSGPAVTNSIAEKLFTGERDGGLSSLGYDVRCFFLCPDDRMKHARIIDERCEQMIMKGLLKETADLYLNEQLPEMAERAIGYRQTLDYLLKNNDDEGGEDTDESTQKQKEAALFDHYLNEFTTATRRYAKKQMSWFRKDEDFIFVPVLLEDSLDKSSRVEHSAKIIEGLCNISRDEYESELYGSPSSSTKNDNDDSDVNNNNNNIESQSMEVKKKNENQAKGMKFYQFERHILKPDSDIYNNVLSEAIELRQRIRRQKKRKIDVIN